MALRMALGASARRLQLVVARGPVLTAGGAAVGGLAAFELTRLMGYLLYRSARTTRRSRRRWPSSCLPSLIACVVPAWRAAHTDPIHALRG